MSLQFNGRFQPIDINHSKDYLHVPFHETSGTSLVINGRNGGVDFSTSFTVQGTTTNIWDNAGFITPAGDNYISLGADAAIKALLIPDGKAGMLFQHTTSTTRSGTDSTQNTILKVNHLGSIGGYDITILNGTNLNSNFVFFYAGEGTAGAPSLSLSGPVDRVGEPVTTWVYMDFTRLYHSMSGTRANTSDNVGWDTSSGTLFSSIDSGRDITLLAGHNFGPVQANFMNAGLATVKLHDLRMWPFYTAPDMNDLYHAISTYGKYPYEDFEA